jgi:hypothetical protein
VKIALLEKDEALVTVNGELQNARTVLTEEQTAMAEKGTALATVQTQLQQDRATLEGSWSWQAQAEQKAKEAEKLGVDLQEKVTLLTAVEEQLRQERSARQQVESQLQQEKSAFKEAQAALQRERSAREEAQRQLQREHAALEEAWATLKLQDAEIMRLTGELVQEGVSYEELRQASEKKDATILELQQAAETVRATLKTEKKQVEGKLPLPIFRLLLGFVEIRSRLNCFFRFQACGWLSGHQQHRQRQSRWPTTPPSRNWRLCGMRPSRCVRALRRATGKLGVPWRAASGPWVVMLPGACGVPSGWGSRRPSAWCSRTTGSTSRRWRRAISLPTVLMMTLRRPRQTA